MNEHDDGFFTCTHKTAKACSPKAKDTRSNKTAAMNGISLPCLGLLRTVQVLSLHKPLKSTSDLENIVASLRQRPTLKCLVLGRISLNSNGHSRYSGVTQSMAFMKQVGLSLDFHVHGKIRHSCLL
jgi:hypothetical protein